MFSVNISTTIVKNNNGEDEDADIVVIKCDPASALTLANMILTGVASSGMSVSWQEALKELAIQVQGAGMSSLSKKAGWGFDDKPA